MQIDSSTIDGNVELDTLRHLYSEQIDSSTIDGNVELDTLRTPVF